MTKLIKNPLILLVLLAVIFRIPSLFEPYWYGDEGIYLTLGEAARQGLVWYRDIHDNKPPLLYIIAALAGSVFWFRLILLVWHAATIVLFFELSTKLFKNRNASILATTFFTILTSLPVIEGNIANAEIFMIGPTIAGMLIIFASKNLSLKRSFLSGLLLSFSTLFKVPAAFDFLSLVTFLGIASLWNAAGIKKAAFRIVTATLGFSLPILATFLYYWSQNALSGYLVAAWGQNLGYLSRWGIPDIANPSKSNGIRLDLFLRSKILAAALATIIIFKNRFDKTTLLLTIWSLFAIFAMLLSGRPYPHYIIQAAPPLSLLLSVLVFGKEKIRYLSVPTFIIFASSLALYHFYYYNPLPYYKNFIEYATRLKTKQEYWTTIDKRVPRTNQIADILKSRTSPKDRIFIWGDEPEIYALSKRLPTGIYTALYHISDFEAESETLQSLASSPPKYIVIINDAKPTPPTQIADFINQNYIYLETIQEAQIYRLVNQKTMQELK